MPLTPIRPEERTPDNNLLPEAKNKVYEEIRTYLTRLGFINYSDIAKQLGINRTTARSFVDEIVQEMREQDMDDKIVRIQWLHSKLQLLRENPEAFAVQNEVHNIALQLALYKEIDKLRDSNPMEKEKGRDISQYFDLSIWGAMKPKTWKLIEGYKDQSAMSVLNPLPDE